MDQQVAMDDERNVAQHQELLRHQQRGLMNLFRTLILGMNTLIDIHKQQVTLLAGYVDDVTLSFHRHRKKILQKKSTIALLEAGSLVVSFTAWAPLGAIGTSLAMLMKGDLATANADRQFSETQQRILLRIMKRSKNQADYLLRLKEELDGRINVLIETFRLTEEQAYIVAINMARGIQIKEIVDLIVRLCRMTADRDRGIGEIFGNLYLEGRINPQLAHCINAIYGVIASKETLRAFTTNPTSTYDKNMGRFWLGLSLVMSVYDIQVTLDDIERNENPFKDKATELKEELERRLMVIDQERERLERQFRPTFHEPPAQVVVFGVTILVAVLAFLYHYFMF